MAALCQDADLLVHEATLEDEMAESAAEKGHSTAGWHLSNCFTGCLCLPALSSVIYTSLAGEVQQMETAARLPRCREVAALFSPSDRI